MLRRPLALAALAAWLLAPGALAQPAAARAKATPREDPRLERLKKEAVAEVEKLAGLTQQMVDSVFSFGELGFQEFETHRYLVSILREHGFTVEEGVAGMPTAFMASWGSGKPVIALGSDIDGIPQASQTPGVAWHKPLVEGAPGHGEGHNSGVPLNITAAIVIKRIMEREKIPGTIRVWPGTAEELVGAKAWFIRDGLFKDVDACLFTHVADNFNTSWGGSNMNGLVSVEYTFRGESAHSAGAPWRGRSALDAVELMNVGWNFRREHLRTQQRSHYVVTGGGDQPNVVPQTASVWYYFRETDYDGVKRMWDIGTTIAEGAAMMTDTKLDRMRVLGAAWPQHMSKPLAEAMTANITAIGLPRWSEADQALARALQRELGQPERGLATEFEPMGAHVEEKDKRGGGSDDIGDISWNVPTITLRYPANVPNLPGHNWANAVAMATPIAHKGVTAGAKAQAMTMIDLLLRPDLVAQAWAYFNDVQTKDTKYQPLIRPDDPPATWMNKGVMERYRPEMRKFYYDPSKYTTYLEQLGVTYPTVRPAAPPGGAAGR
ncbi:MAG: amidohydrolase [Vicinamibacterales bacterium]|nr:amidohydrolase [Vicinamibacterales bacterium]